MTDLQDTGVLVVGASAGIGRALAVRAVKAGAQVLLTARREDRLRDAVEEAGGGAALVADLCNDDDCQRLAQTAAEVLPQLDLVIVAAGMAPLVPLQATTTEQWSATLQTNVVGINRCIGALLPHLAPGAIVAVCSSESVSSPRWGLGAYAASKAALDATLRNWRVEHGGTRFTCVAVGATAPTEFGNGFDRETLETALNKWTTQGLAQTELMRTDEVAAALLDTLASVLPYPGVGLETMLLRSPAPLVEPDDSTADHQGDESR